MSNDNGETNVLNGLDYHEKLDLIIEALRDLSERFDEFHEQHEELVEKLNDINLAGDGYTIYEES